MSLTQQQDSTSEATATGNLFERYGLLSLSELVMWLFRLRKAPEVSEPEPFDEHMNGLA